MKALVKTATSVELQDEPIPTPDKGYALIRVEYAGICHSDLAVISGKIRLNTKLPVTLGHEFSGLVVGVGDHNDSIWMDKRVCSETAYSVCEKCHYCKRGDYNLCKHKELIGYVHDGSFAEYVVVPVNRLHEIPSSIGFQEAVLWEPLACVCRAICLCEVDLEYLPVGIFGAGPVGLLALQVAKEYNAECYVIDPDDDRRMMAGSLGATECYSVGITHGILSEVANVVIECSGTSDAVTQGIRLLKRGGTFIQVGLPSEPVSVNWSQIAYKELTIRGSIGSTRSDWQFAGGLLKKFQLTPLVQTVYPLTNWQKALDSHGHEGFKILLRP